MYTKIKLYTNYNMVYNKSYILNFQKIQNIIWVVLGANIFALKKVLICGRIIILGKGVIHRTIVCLWIK